LFEKVQKPKTKHKLNLTATISTSSTTSLKATIPIIASMTTPPNGTEAERQTWKRWARRNGLTDANGRFMFTSISERRSRFRNGLKKSDILLLRLIEKTMIDIVHMRYSVVERWLETIRTMLNRTSENDQQAVPFESWYGPPGLEKRKQSTRVWADLIQFFEILMFMPEPDDMAVWMQVHEKNQHSLFGDDVRLVLLNSPRFPGLVEDWVKGGESGLDNWTFCQLVLVARKSEFDLPRSLLF
jgi:hypothetical protein